MRTRFADFYAKQEILRNFHEYIADKKIRGSDGVTAVAFAANVDGNAAVIARKVISGTYSFSRYKEKLILKGVDSYPREVCIPTIRDSCVLRCLLAFLIEVFPEARSQKPHAYIDALKRRLKNGSPDDYFVRIDIRDFYPSIDHRLLLASLRKRIKNKSAISLINSGIRTSCKKDAVRECGVPQGLSISNVLANLFLIDCDSVIAKRFGADNYFRYVDDILMVLPKKDAEAAFGFVEKTLKMRKLAIHPLDAKKGKSVICPIPDGVDYLGFSLRPNKISVRVSSVRKIYENISSVITSAKYSKNMARMCFKLDTKITGCLLEGKRYGWLHFFQQMDDVSILRKLDIFVLEMLRGVRSLPKDYAPKRFVKAYYEIRYNFRNSNYIPNFDTKATEEQLRILTQIAPSRYKGIEVDGAEAIGKAFFSEMKKIASELERDLQEPRS